MDFVFDSPLVAAGRGLRRLRRAVVPARARRSLEAARRSDPPHPRATSTFAPGVTTIATAVRRGLPPAPRRLPGLRPPRRSPACARSACRRATSAATSRPRRRPTSRAWSAPTPRTPGSRSTCPGIGWIDARSDQRPRARRPPRHPGLGPRLRRRQPDPRRHPRRRRAADARRGRSRSAVRAEPSRRGPADACGRRDAPTSRIAADAPMFGTGGPEKRPHSGADELRDVSLIRGGIHGGWRVGNARRRVERYAADRDCPSASRIRRRSSAGVYGLLRKRRGSSRTPWRRIASSV